MVTFTCDRCSESLKKPAVSKHLWRCKSSSFTCIDCKSVYDNQTYTTHTKCMTEAERYQGKLYVPKESQDKGQKKQDSWLENIINYINDGHGGKETQFLRTISQHPNVPRKKPKFINFAKSVLRLHDVSKIEIIWNHVNKANEAAKKPDQPEKKGSSNEKSEPAPESGEDTAAATDDGPSKKKLKTGKEREEANDQVESQPSNEENVSQDQENKGDENVDKNVKKRRGKEKKEKIEKYRWKTQITSILAEMGPMKLRKMQSRLYIRYKKQCDPEKQEDKETVYSRIAQAIEKSSKVTFTPQNNMVTLNKNSNKDEE